MDSRLQSCYNSEHNETLVYDCSGWYVLIVVISWECIYHLYPSYTEMPDFMVPNLSAFQRRPVLDARLKDQGVYSFSCSLTGIVCARCNTT